MGGGMMGMQQGTALSGDIVGGIGGLVSSLGYERPKLPPATGMEQRLRQLAQSQLLGGGQQLLGATALYNQLAPILMSQLPGMRYVPGTSGAQDGTGAGAGGGGSPMADYQTALKNYQTQQGLLQQRTALRAQLKGAKGQAAKRAIRQQLRPLKRQIESLPTAAQLERQQYLGGVQQRPEMFDVRMGGQDTATPTSLGSINDLIQGLSTGPNFLDIYRGIGGY